MLSKSHRKCLGFRKSHRKYRVSSDLVAFTKSHGQSLDLAKVMENSKVLPKVMENTDLALIWLPSLKVMENAQDLAKVMEIIDLTLTWLPFLKVPKNALDLAKVMGKFKGSTKSHRKCRQLTFVRLKNFDKNIQTDLDKNIWTDNSVE